MSFRDRTFAEPRHAPARIYPVAQWRHARGPKESGGLEVPTRYFPDAESLAGLPAPLEINHQSTIETAWLFSTFHLAFVGFRPVLWERRRAEIVETAPATLDNPWEHGYRSRRRFLVVVKELWEAGYHGFVALSTRATASQDVSQILNAAGRFRQTAGHTATGTAFPEYAFWVPATAGRPEKASSHDGSQSSFISPLTSLVPEKPTTEDFERLAIPLDVQTFIEAGLSEVEEWEQQVAGPVPTATRRPTEAEAIELEEVPAAPARAERSKGDIAAGPPDYLRLTMPFGTKAHPEFRGQPLGDLLASPAGRRFIEYLATRHTPRDTLQEQLVHGARALSAAGLAR